MEEAVIHAIVDRYLRILQIGVLILGLCPFLFSSRDTVHAEDAISHTWQAGATCAGPSQLNSKSLLVVLQDRSGSLITGPTTDPEGYSGSVTNALADLWPGNIAVIPFGNDRADKLGKGVFAHSNTSDLTTLKNLVNGTFPPPNDANTPLGLAMQSAKMLFEQQGVTPCSQVVIVTDGQPTGPKAMVDEIHSQFNPWFKSQGIPVNAFGLRLDTSTEDGRNADALLREIATVTNGEYTPVVNATDLASNVIGLYSKWKGLSFTRISLNQQNGNYPILVDDNVTQATIISFHSTNVSVGQLQRSDGAAIQSFQTTDRHYQMDNLISPIPSGTYTITVGSNDPDASVYALIDSPLKAAFTDIATTAYTGQTFTIKAHLINDQHIGVIKGATKFTTTVTRVINGNPEKVIVVLNRLAPDSDIFVGNYLVPPTDTKLIDKPQLIGTLTLDLTATEGDVTRSATTTVPLYVPQAPPPPPCSKGFVQCQVIPNLSQIIVTSSFLCAVLLLLLFALLWRRQPEPRGYLISKTNASRQIKLNKRDFGKKLLRRTAISSDEIQNHPDAIGGGFAFGLAKFVITSKYKDKKYKGKDHLQVSKDNTVPIAVKTKALGQMQSLAPGKSYPLNQDDIIAINGTEKAVYSQTPSTKRR